jgi:hypothetical protein
MAVQVGTSALVGSRVAIGECSVTIDLRSIAFARSCPAIDFRLNSFPRSSFAVGQRGLAIESGFGTVAGSRSTILRGSAPGVGGVWPGRR